MHERSNREYNLLAICTHHESTVHLCGSQVQFCHARLCFVLSEFFFSIIMPKRVDKLLVEVKIASALRHKCSEFTTYLILDTIYPSFMPHPLPLFLSLLFSLYFSLVLCVFVLSLLLFMITFSSVFLLFIVFGHRIVSSF